MDRVGEALSWGERALSGSGASGRADAMLLLAHALTRHRAWIVAHPEAPVSAQERADFGTLCDRRARGTPVAYLLRSAGFYGREFIIDEHVLVPRPETEHLAEEAIRFIQERTPIVGRPISALDVGVGSGAIACTIAAETSASVTGTDISAEAVKIATENAHRLGVGKRCRFYQGDLVEPVSGQRFDVVIANLPYIPTSDLPQPPDPASFEPRAALDGGPDGLTHYRRLLPQIPRLLHTDGLALLEAAPPTIERLKALAQLSLPTFAISASRDYADLPRYVRANGVPLAQWTATTGR